VNEATLPLLALLLKCGKILESKLDGCLGEAELTTTRLLTLRHIESDPGPVALGDIAQCMAFAKSNATQLVDSLESAGFVRRVPDLQDRRCTHVEVTKTGRDAGQSAREYIRPLLERVEKTLSASEQAQFHSLLSRLLATLVEE
jgi:DNA-binding MarR family transcriptional regulator